MNKIQVINTDNSESQSNRVYNTDGIAPTINSGSKKSGNQSPMIQVKSATATGYEEAKEGDSVNYSVPNSATRRGRVGHQQAQTIDTAAKQGVIVKAVTETRTDEAKQIRKQSMKEGKDFSPRRGKELKLRDDDNANTITSTQSIEQSVFFGTNEQYRIRRLTEVECERLQGFPDNHTMYGNYDGEIKKISKTQRYKMCGNAVTVDVVQMIGKKLFNTLQKNIVNE